MARLGPLGEKPQAIDVMREGCAVLDSLGVKWWLSAGTALGFYRQGGFIPHDSDIDVGVEGLHKDLVQAFFDAGFKEHKFDKEFQRAFYKDDVVFDVYVFEKDGDNMTSFTAIGDIIKPYRLFENLEALICGGLPYPVPSPIEDYLEVRFGPDWKTPKPSKGKWTLDCPCFVPNKLNR